MHRRADAAGPSPSAGWRRGVERLLGDHPDAAMVVTAAARDPVGSPRVVFVNAAFSRLTGYASADLVDRPACELPTEHTEWGSGAFGAVTVRAHRKDGAPFWAGLRVTPFADEAGRFTHWLVLLRDSPAPDLADAERLRLLHAALDSLPARTCVLNAEGVILSVNRGWAEASRSAGGGEGTGIGVDYLAVCELAGRAGDRNAAEVAQGVRDVLAGRHPRFELEYPCPTPAGEEAWFALLAVPLDPVMGGAVVTHTDITVRVQAEQELRRQALHDPLTGLPNRTLFLERLAEALAVVEREGGRRAVLFLDLDHFKGVNDSLGHAAGDALLREVARRLSALLRPDDVLARLGGDEFVALCRWSAEPEQVGVLAERFAEALQAPLVLEGHELRVTVSMGVVLAGPGAGDPEALLRDADAAMYRAKARGRARWELFDEGVRQGVIARLSLEHGLRRALERDELTLAYQPVVGLADGAMVGLEALLRWRQVPPERLVGVAEEAGFMPQLGAWVLRRASAQAAAWRAAGQLPEGSRVTVNIAARQLAWPGFAEEVQAALAESGLEPSLFGLEVTEAALLAVDAAVPALGGLAALGIELAVDDFGTGFSSLRLLKRLPVAVLKVDRSFVAGLLERPEEAAIVEAALALARSLGASVVAEGVESEPQLARLRELGCPRAQGFLLARPAPAAEVLPPASR